MPQTVLVPCVQCDMPSPFNHFQLYRVLIQSEQPMVFTCTNGHTNYIYHQSNLAEQLFKYGFEAFIADDYRSAVLSFASALERLYKYVVMVILKENKIGPDITTNIKKFLNNSSEREFGSFICLYSMRFNRLPFKNKQHLENQSNFRNKIVHKGQFPSREKTREYGEFAISILHFIMKDLIENVDHNILREVSREMSNFDQLQDKQNFSVTTVCDSIVSWSYLSDEEIRNEENLQKYSSKDPHKYAEFAAQANKSQKRLWVAEDESMTLLTPEEYESKCSKRLYRGEKSFDDYCDALKQMSNYPFNVIDCVK